MNRLLRSSFHDAVALFFSVMEQRLFPSQWQPLPQFCCDITIYRTRFFLLLCRYCDLVLLRRNRTRFSCHRALLVSAK